MTTTSNTLPSIKSTTHRVELETCPRTWTALLVRASLGLLILIVVIMGVLVMVWRVFHLGRGSQLAYRWADGNTSGIEMVDLSTKLRRSLVADQPALQGYLAWSPDGNYIAFALRSQQDLAGNLLTSHQGFASEIYLINVFDNSLQRLTQLEAFSDNPIWSPDGRRIAFISGRDSLNNNAVFVMDADGQGVHPISSSRVIFDDFPSWSPDGRHIAFQSQHNGDWEIVVSDADGTNLHRLTTSPGTDVKPVWSPDGNQIAFASGRDGNPEIYIMQPDGDNLRRLTHNTVIDGNPAWSPDGTHIAFVSNRALSIMDSSGENQRVLAKLGALKDTPPIWSPDGQQIAFVSSVESLWSAYTVNVNGGEPRLLMGNLPADATPLWWP